MSPNAPRSAGANWGVLHQQGRLHTDTQMSGAGRLCWGGGPLCVRASHLGAAASFPGSVLMRLLQQEQVPQSQHTRSGARTVSLSVSTAWCTFTHHAPRDMLPGSPDGMLVLASALRLCGQG